MGAKKEIVSEMATLTKIMITDNKKFFIPDFQRSFVWGEDEIKQLFDDFAEDTNNFTIESDNLEGYLLGNIVLIEQDNGKAMVIDGQQRLTTITLIYRVLEKIVSSKVSSGKAGGKWAKNIGDLSRGYSVLNDNFDFQGLRIEHDKNLGFGKFYSKLLVNSEDDNDDEIKEEDIETEEDENIFDVYTYAYEYLQDLSEDQLMKFINFYKNKVKLIVTTAQTEAKAFQLFEILNDRGRSLEPMDLIKNTFLKCLHQDTGVSNQKIDIFVSDWKDTLANLQNGKKKISSSSFLKYYILSFCGKNIQAKDLFEFIKKPENGLTAGTAVLEFASGMKKASKVISKIEQKDYSGFNYDYNMYILFELLKIKQFYPIFILFNDSADDKKSKILDALVRYGAAVVFSFTQTNYIESELPDIIQEYLNNKKQKDDEKAFDLLLDTLEKKIKEVADIAKAVISERNYVGRGGEAHTKALQLLKFIELYFNNNPIVKQTPRGKRLTAEHIQSRNMNPKDYKLNKLGYSDEDERVAYLHRIGNLTILYHTENSSLGNQKFADKKSCYSNSDFIITSTIIQPKKTTQKSGKDKIQCDRINKYEKTYVESKEGHWTKEKIVERSKDIADLVYDVLINKAVAD